MLGRLRARWAALTNTLQLQAIEVGQIDVLYFCKWEPSHHACGWDALTRSCVTCSVIFLRSMLPLNCAAMTLLMLCAKT